MSIKANLITSQAIAEIDIEDSSRVGEQQFGLEAPLQRGLTFLIFMDLDLKKFSGIVKAVKARNFPEFFVV